MNNDELQVGNWWDYLEEEVVIEPITDAIRTKYGFIDMDNKDPFLTGNIKRFEIEQMLLTNNGGPFEELDLDIIFNYQEFAIGKVNGHYFIVLMTIVEVILVCHFPDGWRTINKADFDEELAVVYERCSETLALESLERCIELMNGNHAEVYMPDAWICELTPSAHDELIELMWIAHQHLQTNNKNKELTMNNNTLNVTFSNEMPFTNKGA